MSDSGGVKGPAKPVNSNYKNVSKVAVRALKQRAFADRTSRLGTRTVVVDTDFTWSITDWYGLELGPNGDIKSPPVEINGMKYTIAVYPRGAGAARNTHISVFLHVEPADPNCSVWKVPCTFGLMIWNPKKPALHRALEVKDFEFSAFSELNWGCAKLCEMAAADSIVGENAANITIYLRVYDDDKFLTF